MLQVKKIEGRTLCSNTYVLSCKGETSCFLVDIGDFTLVKNQLPESLGVKGILLTHGHFDHIAGINDLLSVYPDVVVYTNEKGREMLYSDKLNLSKYHELPIRFNGDRVHMISDGEIIQLFEDEEITAIYTPGHNDSCITYYNNNYIFTGDSYIEGATVVTKLPGGKRALAEISLHKILSLSEGRKVFSGHDVDRWESIF